MTSSPEGRQEAAVAPPKSEVEKLRDELHLMKTAGIIEVAVRNPSVAEYMSHWEERAIKAESALSALPAPVAAAPVGVKAIRWPEQCPKGKRVHADGAGWTYSIVHYGEPYIYRWAAGEGSWSDPFETYDGAKAAVQKDYEARIRSALIAAKPSVELVEANETERLVRASQWLQERWSQKHPNTAHIRQLADYEAFLAALQAPATPDAQTEVEK